MMACRARRSASVFGSDDRTDARSARSAVESALGPSPAQLDVPGLHRGPLLVVIEAELAAVRRLQLALVDHRSVEVQRDPIAVQLQVHRVPLAGLQGELRRASAVLRLVEGVVGRQSGGVLSPERHPVEAHAVGLQQEGQPVDRRMDHDLVGLVEELVGQGVSIAERAIVIEPALAGDGVFPGRPHAGPGVGERAATADDSVDRAPVEGFGIGGPGAWTTTMTRPRDPCARSPRHLGCVSRTGRRSRSSAASAATRCRRRSSSPRAGRPA